MLHLLALYNDPLNLAACEWRQTPRKGAPVRWVQEETNTKWSIEGWGGLSRPLMEGGAVNERHVEECRSLLTIMVVAVAVASTTTVFVSHNYGTWIVSTKSRVIWRLA